MIYEKRSKKKKYESIERVLRDFFWMSFLDLSNKHIRNNQKNIVVDLVTCDNNQQSLIGATLIKISDSQRGWRNQSVISFYRNKFDSRLMDMRMFVRCFLSHYILTCLSIWAKKWTSVDIKPRKILAHGFRCVLFINTFWTPIGLPILLVSYSWSTC